MPDDFGVMQYRKAIMQARGRMMCCVICHGSGGVDGVLVRRGVLHNSRCFARQLVHRIQHGLHELLHSDPLYRHIVLELL